MIPLPYTSSHHEIILFPQQRTTRQLETTSSLRIHPRRRKGQDSLPFPYSGSRKDYTTLPSFPGVGRRGYPSPTPGCNRRHYHFLATEDGRRHYSTLPPHQTTTRLNTFFQSWRQQEILSFSYSERRGKRLPFPFSNGQ